MEEFLSKTRKEIISRDAQLREMYNLICGSDEPLPLSLFICGPSCSGKTMCLEAILKHLKYKFAIVNCIECYTPKIMFETIVNEFYDAFNCDSSWSRKCDNARDFLNNMQRLSNLTDRYEPLVVIFDKAERLRMQDHSLISLIVRMKEFTQLNICTILVTHLIYENFTVKVGMRDPIKLFFPNYNKEELFNIIFKDQIAFANYTISRQDLDIKTQWQIQQPELFANFLNAFLSVFYRACRDLTELKHMARINFIKYCEPIIKNEIDADDLPKLWRHISPILKTSIELLYLRINTTSTDDSIENNFSNELTSTKVFAQSFELPYYAKYLLIAAYLASYNPQKEDKRLFVKNHGKQKKRLQHVKAKAKINEKLNTQLGPKLFTLDRLLAIFYAILDEKIGLTSNLLSQIATLVELKLLSGNKEVDLDGSKYKCVVGYEFITAVASTVGFNVRKYLYDFM